MKRGAEIEGERIFVVVQYDDQFGPTEKTSTLLVNAELREEYSKLFVAIEEAKAKLLKAIRERAGSKQNFEGEISNTFTSGDDIETALNRIDKELREQNEVLFSDVQYDKIFNDKVLKALETKDLKIAIDGYIRRYNKLLEDSTCFKKGTFDYFNAGQKCLLLTDFLMQSIPSI
ncbi:MAG: hypothetical protein WDN46_03190 [Methylocella sp.]